jgi:hypothetical protein
MRLSYDGIEFKILKVENYSSTAIFDSMASLDYLYDEVKLDVVCILNQDVTDKREFPKPSLPPGTTIIQGINQIPGSQHRPFNGLQVLGQYEKTELPAGAVNGPDGLANGDRGPAATLVELLRRLAQPRRVLRVWMDSNPNPQVVGEAAEEIVLLSPLPGYSEDPCGGPVCTYKQPIPIGGNSTVALRLQFETHIPACTGKDAPIMLSNRWSFTVGAENDFAIHQIEGEARFRMDLLHKQGFTADQFRNQFLHPIPVGFRRESPTVTLLPTGDGVKYTLVDRQMPLNFPGGIPFACNKIEIVESRVYRAPVGIIAKYVG